MKQSAADVKDYYHDGLAFLGSQYRPIDKNKRENVVKKTPGSPGARSA